MVLLLHSTGSSPEILSSLKNNDPSYDYHYQWEKDPAFITHWTFSVPLLDDEENNYYCSNEINNNNNNNNSNNNNENNTITCDETTSSCRSNNNESLSRIPQHYSTNCTSQLSDDLPDVPDDVIATFQTNGFVVFPTPVLSNEACMELNIQLEEILRGRYNTGIAPDKTPKKFNNEYIGSEYYQQLQQQQQFKQQMEQQEKQPQVLDEKQKEQCANSIITTNLCGATATIKDKIDNKSNEKDDTAIIIQQQQPRTYPKKQIPKAIVGPIGFSGNYNNVRVVQVINAQKANKLYSKLGRNAVLGKIVTDLMGWSEGARLAQDQIWAKPPQAPPLAFHRDSPYFMFTPSDVCTVWIALDDMDTEIGPLQYVRGSHLWKDGKCGTAQQFFQTQGGIDLLVTAATLGNNTTNNNNNNETKTTTDTTDVTKTSSGIVDTTRNQLDIVSVAGIPAGSISIHDGRTWHGSTKNNSFTRPRRGIGLHYVPINVQFTSDAQYSIQWKHYLQDNPNIHPSDIILPIEDFPIPYCRRK